jgi:PLD-like domain
MSLIRYHSQTTVVGAIHRLMAQSTICRIAVAYCGKEAYMFFPDSTNRRPVDLRVIVDASEEVVSRGLTNPAGLSHLLGLTNRVKSLAGLHAKAYIFDEAAAIVGSVNMSAGSINKQYQASLEVSDRTVVRQLIEWFDVTLWRNQDAKVVDSDVLASLRVLWSNAEFHSSSKRPTGSLPKWRGELPQPPLALSDFEIGVSDLDLGRLLLESRQINASTPEMVEVALWCR